MSLSFINPDNGGTKTFTLTASPIAALTADANGDSWPDIISLQSDGSIDVQLFQNTLQTYAYPVQSYDPYATSLAAGQLLGSGAIQLVTASATQNIVTVLTNSGNGYFNVSRTYAVGTDPVSVSLIDVNKDGYPDIVTTNKGSNSISILLNEGNGTFYPATNFAVGVAPVAVYAASFTSSRNTDLVVANREATMSQCF